MKLPTLTHPNTWKIRSGLSHCFIYLLPNFLVYTSICILITSASGFSDSLYPPIDTRIVPRLVFDSNALESDTNSARLPSMIYFINSSSVMRDILLVMDGPPLSRISADSFLSCTDCIMKVRQKVAYSPFICEGEMKAERLNLQCEDISHSIFESDVTPTGAPIRSASSVQIHSSYFSSILLSDTVQGFISGRGIQTETIIGCSFVNVSRGMDGEKNVKGGLLNREECILSQSSIIGGENGIYGAIVTGLMEGNGGGYSFECTNNTFRECQHYNLHRHAEMNPDYTDRSFTSRFGLSNSYSYTFTNCSFNRCYSSSTSDPSAANGGAICFRGSSYTYNTLTVTRCTFTSCYAYGHGGAIQSAYSASTVVTSCSLYNCSTVTEYLGGGVSVAYHTSCVAVKDSNITSCTSGAGGGVYFTADNSTGSCVGGVNSGIVSGCRISKCSSTSTSYSGGGVLLQNVSVSTVRSCSFSSCSAYYYGGGIAWGYLTSQQLSLSEWILDCVFENNSASYYGRDVFIAENNNRYNSIIDNLSYTVTNKTNRVVWYSTNHDNWLPYRIPFTGTIYVDPYTTSSSSSCGPSISPCGSINGAMQSSYYGTNSFTGIVLMEGTHSNDGSRINIGKNSLPLTNNGTVKFDVPSSFSSSSNVFEISSGTLNMSGFTIVLKRKVGSGCKLIYISGGGSVILYSMNISGGSSKYGTNNTPLLDIGNGKITCNDVSLKNISRLSGNGTIFDFTSLSTSITLSGMTFNQCECSNGNGGVIGYKEWEELLL